MTDKRTQRKANVVRFLTILDKNRLENFKSLVASAKQLEMEGFHFEFWDNPTWTIDSGRLLKLTGKNVKTVTLKFYYALALGDHPLESEWGDVIKAIVALRFHRSHQSAPNQRNFITAISYVSYEMMNAGKRLFQLTPEFLDAACRRLSHDYTDGVAYNMHKAIV